MGCSNGMVIKGYIVLLGMLVVFVPAIAQGCGGQGTSCSIVAPVKPAPTKVEKVKIKGEIICTACTLKHEEGAKAQCSIYGHDHSVKVDKIIDAEGKEISLDYPGKIYQVLPNDRSKDLLKKDNNHKKVTISGEIYPNANLIEVESYSINEDKKTEEYKWCEKCKAMVTEGHTHE